MTIKTQGLGKSHGTKPILQNIDVSLSPGEVYGVIGPSGAGKTTLLRILAGLEVHDRGTISHEHLGTSIGPRGNVQLVYQDYQLFPHMTVWENVAFGPRSHHWKTRDLDQGVRSILQETGLLHLAHRYPNQLSGGEQQRCALARALILTPPWLLLDEPFANLDPGLKHSMAALIGNLCKGHNTGLLVVSHDFPVLFAMVTKVLVILQGSLVYCGTVAGLDSPDLDPMIQNFLFGRKESAKEHTKKGSNNG